MAMRTPLYDRHVAAGGRMVDFAGFEMPVRYGSIGDEHAAVRERVGLFDVSHMGEIRVRGPEAAACLDRLVTNDVRGMAVGQARYTPMCNAQGGVVDDLVLYRLAEDDFLVVVNAANREKDFAWMTAHATGDATLVDEGDAWCQLAVQGPAAVEVVRGLTDVPVDDLGNYTCALGTVQGADGPVAGCVVARTGYTGEDGFEIYGPAEAAGSLWDAVVAAGEPHGLALCGLGARDTLRLEARMPLYGHELTDDLSPRQARLARTIVDDKPEPFVGQAALDARRDADTHFLAGLLLDGKRIAREGMTVSTPEGVEVGWVSSGARSPTIGRSVALVFVARGHGKPGTKLVVDVRGREATGTVVRGVFHKLSL